MLYKEGRRIADRRNHVATVSVQYSFAVVAVPILDYLLVLTVVFLLFIEEWSVLR